MWDPVELLFEIPLPLLSDIGSDRLSWSFTKNHKLKFIFNDFFFDNILLSFPCHTLSPPR